jgi:hypothetical protein
MTTSFQIGIEVCRPATCPTAYCFDFTEKIARSAYGAETKFSSKIDELTDSA